MKAFLKRLERYSFLAPRCIGQPRHHKDAAYPDDFRCRPARGTPIVIMPSTMAG